MARTRTAAFFDLDKTIIAKSSTLAFSRSFYQGGLINRRAVLRSAYAQFVYLVGGADHDQMERMRAYLSSMATGWDVEQVKVIVAETLHELIDPLIYDEAVTLIEEHHLAGRDVVIVSIVRRRGRRADRARCSAPTTSSRPGWWWARTAATAERSSTTRTARPRRRRSASWPRPRATTWPAAMPTATRQPTCRCSRPSDTPPRSTPTAALRKEAVARDWPVLVFARPVRLRDRFTGVSLPHAEHVGSRRGQRRSRHGRRGVARRAPARARPGQRLPRVGRATRRAAQRGTVKKGGQPFPRTPSVRYT